MNPPLLILLDSSPNHYKFIGNFPSNHSIILLYLSADLDLRDYWSRYCIMHNIFINWTFSTGYETQSQINWKLLIYLPFPLHFAHAHPDLDLLLREQALLHVTLEPSEKEWSEHVVKFLNHAPVFQTVVRIEPLVKILGEFRYNSRLYFFKYKNTG